jgi:hypothetical protein
VSVEERARKVADLVGPGNTIHHAAILHEAKEQIRLAKHAAALAARDKLFPLPCDRHGNVSWTAEVEKDFEETGCFGCFLEGRERAAREEMRERAAKIFDRWLPHMAKWIRSLPLDPE